MSKQTVVRIIFSTMIIIGIFIIYYTVVVLEDFNVFTNPEGPDTSDYFAEEELEE